MARVKPRAGGKRRRSSSSGCSEAEQQAEEELQTLQCELASGDEHQPQEDLESPLEQPEQENGAVSDSSYQPVARQWQQRRIGRQHSAPEQTEPVGRPRPRKRKPGSQSAAVEQATGRPGKRRRGTGGRATYREVDDNDDDVFDYAFASSSEEETAHAAGSMDQNESHCRACGSEADADKLLCCERCPAVYHLYCLDPPLAKVPRGSWLCPLCAEADHMLEACERVLAVRNAQHQILRAGESEAKVANGAHDQEDTVPAAAEATAAGGKPSREFFVKWRERAYLHCSWVPEHVVNRAAAVRVIGQANPVVQRLRKFWRDQAAAAVSGELEEAEETGELVNGIHPAWTQVDKVLAKRPAQGGSGVEYLVSWKQLPLDQATWEAEQDLGEFSAEIAAYQAAQVPISAEAAARACQQRADAQAKAAVHEAVEVDGENSAAAAATGERGAGTRKFTSTPDFVAGGPLHPYQLEGLNWLYHKAHLKDNVILADEMGLGKTIQTIAFLGALWKDCVKLPHLVVVPLTTLSNWERELSTWAPYLTVVSLHGSAAARQLLVDHCFFAPAEPGHGRGRAALQDRVRFHVLLTTYEMVSKHLADIRRLDWAALVVDEAHRLKNATSRLFQDLVRVDAKHRLLLTGTPLQNSLEELFFLMNFLEPAKFPSLEVFKETYASLDDKDKVSELHRQLAPHLLRRLKKDVLKQLPPKMEQIVRVELSEEQRQLYKAILSKNYEALVDKSKSAVRLRNVMMELRKAVNHPCLLSFDLQTPAYLAAVAKRKAAATAAAAAARDAASSGAAAPRACEEIEQLIAASGKLALLDRMMVRLHAAGHRVLIYSQFTRTLDVLEDWITGRGWGYERIDGDVAGLERQRRVDAFNSNVGGTKFVFLLSTRAGGLGINLATADTVIIYDSDWNPHNDLQALARAHRMGQRRSVMVLRLVCRATVEERMLQRAKSKMVLEHLVVAKAAKSDKLAQAELDDILRYGAKELFADDEEDQPEKAAAGPDGTADGTAAADAAHQAAAKPKSHMRIVWDDAAIDRLLDRSQVEAAAAAAAGEEEKGDDEFTTAFKVANFDMVVDEEPAEPEQPSAPAAAPAVDTAADSAAAGEDDLLSYDPAATELHKSQQAFWAAILGTGPEAAATAASEPPATAALGQRRARNAARYIFFDSDSETESGSERSQDSDEDLAGGAESGGQKRQRGRPRKKRPEDDDVEYQAADEHSESEEIDDDDYLEAALRMRAASEPFGAADEAITVAAAGDKAQHIRQKDKVMPQQARLTAQPQQDRLAAEQAAAAAAVAAAVGRSKLSIKPAVTGAPAAAVGDAPAAAVGDAAAAQQQSQADLPPRVAGAGPSLLVCGLNTAERHAFMNVFMHFGPPFIHKQPDLGWAPYEQHITGKSQRQLASYMLVLLEHLDECAADPRSTYGSYDYLPHSLLLISQRGQLSPVKIWERLTALHLLAKKLWDHGGKPPAAFVLGGRDAWPAAGGGRGRAGGLPLYRTLSCKPGGWGPAQDFDMVRGIFLAGYECWLKVLSLPAMANMRRALRIELNLDLEYDSKAREAEAASPNVATLTPEQRAQQVQVHGRTVAALLKREIDWLDRRAKHFVTALRQDYEAERQAQQQPSQQQQSQPQQQHGRQQQVQQPQPVHTQPAAVPHSTRPTCGQQAAAQRQAAQLAMQAQQQQRARMQQQQQQQKVPQQIVTAPAGASWRTDLVHLYNGMTAQLQRIKQEASTAIRNDRPDDPNSMQNAAEEFRASVKNLQQQASTMETVLQFLLPQPQPEPQPQLLPAPQQHRHGVAPQQQVPRPVVSTSQQQQQQQAMMVRQQQQGLRHRHQQSVTTAVQPLTLQQQQQQQPRPLVQQLQPRPPMPQQQPEQQQQRVMHQGPPAQLQQAAAPAAQQPSSPDVVIID